MTIKELTDALSVYEDDLEVCIILDNVNYGACVKVGYIECSQPLKRCEIHAVYEAEESKRLSTRRKQ